MANSNDLGEGREAGDNLSEMIIGSVRRSITRYLFLLRSCDDGGVQNARTVGRADKTRQQEDGRSRAPTKTGTQMEEVLGSSSKRMGGLRRAIRIPRTARQWASLGGTCVFYRSAQLDGVQMGGGDDFGVSDNGALQRQSENPKVTRAEALRQSCFAG